VTASDDPELSVVLPVFNEGENIVRVLGALEREVRTPHEVIVVYDFEEDTTIPPVRALAMPSVRLLRNEIGRGVLNAMRSGISAARAPLVLISMADGSDDPAVIDSMVQKARAGADVVAASRYMRGGRQEGGPFLKTLLSRAAGQSLHLLAGLPIHDATSNFRLYKRSLLERIPIESTAGFELALELTVKAHLVGARIAEVPTIWRDRTAGTSKFQLRAWLPGYLRWYLRAFTGRFRPSR
jgi:glycosyltransferase involved in cell wall biosynthesis